MASGGLHAMEEGDIAMVSTSSPLSLAHTQPSQSDSLQLPEAQALGSNHSPKPPISRTRRTSSLGARPTYAQPTGAPRPILKRSISVPTLQLAPQFLRALRRWMVCFVIVKFDLDLGPDFDNCYPPAQFSQTERSQIAFAAFPDAAKTGSLSFSWRIPRPPTEVAEREDSPSASYDLHGYVWFLQQRDESLKRGYSQRSLVLITHLPDYPGLFSTILSVLGPLHAKHGSAMLEAAVHNIARWPAPTPGSRPELAFLGSVRSFSIPMLHQSQPPIPLSTPRRSLIISSPSLEDIPASVPNSFLSEHLFGGPASSRISLGNLWLLWELLVLSEPILVYAASPRTASEVVLHLRNMIRPMPFAGDWRPYLTIHDPDFGILVNSLRARPGLLVGATNPVILTACRHWPHILSLANQHGAAGLLSERKRYIKRDKVVVKGLEMCIARQDWQAADAAILRQFTIVTEQFLQPLNRYFSTLIPVDQDSLSIPSRPTAFSQSAFLKSLKTHDTPLHFRTKFATSMSSSAGSAAAFYTRFLRSPNWGSWLHARMDDAAKAVRSRYLERLEQGNIEQWVHGKSNSDIIDLLARLEHEMRISDAGPALLASPRARHERSRSRDLSTPPASPSASASSKLPATPSLSDRSTVMRSPEHVASPSTPSRSSKLKTQADRLRSLQSKREDSASDSDASSYRGY